MLLGDSWAFNSQHKDLAHKEDVQEDVHIPYGLIVL